MRPNIALLTKFSGFVPSPTLPKKGQPKLQTSGVAWKANEEIGWKPFTVDVKQMKKWHAKPQIPADPYEDKALRKMSVEDYLAGGFGLPHDFQVQEDAPRVIEMPTPDSLQEAEKEQVKARVEATWQTLVPRKLKGKPVSPGVIELPDVRLKEVCVQEVVSFPTSPSPSGEWESIEVTSGAGVYIPPSATIVSTNPPYFSRREVYVNGRTLFTQVISYTAAGKGSVMEACQGADKVKVIRRGGAPHSPVNKYIVTVKHHTQMTEKDIDDMAHAFRIGPGVKNLHSYDEVKYSKAFLQGRVEWDIGRSGVEEFPGVVKGLLEVLCGSDLTGALKVCRKHPMEWKNGDFRGVSGLARVVFGGLHATRWDLSALWEVFENGLVRELERQALAAVWDDVLRGSQEPLLPTGHTYNRLEYLPSVTDAYAPLPTYHDAYRAALRAKNIITPYPPPSPFPHQPSLRPVYIPLTTLEWVVSQRLLTLQEDPSAVCLTSQGLPPLSSRVEHALGSHDGEGDDMVVSVEVLPGVNIGEVFKMVVHPLAFTEIQPKKRAYTRRSKEAPPQQLTEIQPKKRAYTRRSKEAPPQQQEA